MYARCFGKVVACAVFVAWALSVSYAAAQMRREIRPNTAPMPVQPAVPLATPAPQAAPAPAPSPQENATPAPPAAAGPERATVEERTPSAGVGRAAEGRLMRGRELIGMNIWGRTRERLGVVKDFIVDYEGACPTLFFAMAPEIAGWNEGYVIVPFDAFQIGYDERQKTDHFVLDVAVDSLRRAPHLEIDRWNSLHDRQFFANARQFYQRVERTAGRPESGVGREGRRPSEEQMRQPSERQGEAPAPPRLQSPSGTAPGTHRESGVSPQPSPPTPTPGTVSPRSDSGAGKPESGPRPGSHHDSGTGPQPSPPAAAPEAVPQKSGSDTGKRESGPKK